MRVDILIAGAAIATVGPAWVIAADACSYLLFALTLTSVRLQPAAPSDQRMPRRRATGSGSCCGWWRIIPGFATPR
jgi:hypothetical protein